MTSQPEIPAQLFCQICGKAIPEEKAKRRSNTCGTKECVNALRRFRAAILNQGKCPHCYHPSSPAEWERYRRWRQWEANQNDTTLQAFMKDPSGMTLKALARKLIRGLGSALEAAQARRSMIIAQSTMKNGGEPDLWTLPAAAALEVHELDKPIADWTEILELARKVLPEKAVDAKAAH